MKSILMRVARGVLFVHLFFILQLSQAKAHLCAAWNAAKVIGSLPADLLPEASGLAISNIDPNRLYHINDSGNDFAMIMTDLSGKNKKEIRLEGMKTKDTEELASGHCFYKHCLFIGDIGDNAFQRESIQVGWLEEKQTYAAVEKLSGHVTLTYPNGPHNAESMIIHPDGNLYIFSKGRATNAKFADPAQIYKISVNKLLQSHGMKMQMEFVGELDLPSLLQDEKPAGQIATGASINSEGDRLLILTYNNVLELSWSSLMSFKQKLIEGIDFNIIPAAILPQQEAISFMPNSESFLVTSEGGNKNTPILQFNCRR